MSDTYATHLPILGTFRPRSVLEFGPGVHSTHLFLSMPTVERLVSVERDPAWYERLREDIHDPRWKLRRTAPKDIKDFDLIFIDDGLVAEERVETIRWVLSRKHPTVVIHDTETPEYQRAIGGIAQHIHAAQTPWTSVIQ